MDFAETLKRLMKLKGMSRYKLAKEIPCSQASVGNWLNELYIEGLITKAQLIAKRNQLLSEPTPTPPPDPAVMQKYPSLTGISERDIMS